MYQRRANEIGSALAEAFPGVSLVFNEQKPRRNSFEITLCKPDGTMELLHSGIKLVSPQKEPSI